MLLMSIRPKRKHLSRPNQTSLVDVSQTNAKGLKRYLAESRSSSWTLTLMVGFLLAAICYSISNPAPQAPVTNQSTAEVYLLVTNQLDALFTAVESELNKDPNRLPTYQKLLDTFLIFDRDYVKRPGVDPITRLAKAYAARRMGDCSQVSGRFDESVVYYRQSREHFQNCLLADPTAVELYALWLNTFSRVIHAELSRGASSNAQKEYRAALRSIKDSLFPNDFEYNRAVLPELRSLAQLGIELKLYAEAMDVAHLYSKSSHMLTKQLPNNTDFQQDAADADLCLNVLDSLLRGQGNP